VNLQHPTHEHKAREQVKKRRKGRYSSLVKTSGPCSGRGSEVPQTQEKVGKGGTEKEKGRIVSRQHQGRKREGTSKGLHRRGGMKPLQKGPRRNREKKGAHKGKFLDHNNTRKGAFEG